MVQRQELVVPLGAGVNEAVPRELLPVGQLRDVQNGRMRKPGRLEKRYGYELVASGTGAMIDATSLTSPGQRLLRRDDELLMIDDNSMLVSYSAAADRWKSRSTAPEAQVANRRTIGQTYYNGTIVNTCTAQVGDYVAHAWDDTQNGRAAFVRIYDNRTGTLVAELHETGANAQRPHVIAVGSYFVIVFRLGTAAPYTLRAYTYNTTTFTFSAAASLTTLATTDTGEGAGAFDVYTLDSNSFVLLNRANAGTLDLYKFNVNPVALADSELNIRNGKTVGYVSLYVWNVIYCAFWNDTDGTVEVKGHSTSTLAQSWAAQVIATPGASYSDPLLLAVGEKDNAANEAWVTWELQPVGGSPTIQYGFGWRQVNSAGTVHGTTHDQRNLRLFSRPFAYNGRSYICTVSPSGNAITLGTIQGDQSAILVVDLGNASVADSLYRVRPVARFAEGETGVATHDLSPVPVSVGQTGIAHVAFPVWDPNYVWSLTATPTATSVGAAQLRFPADQQEDTHWSGWSEVGTNTLIPGGLLYNYDGDLLRELWSYYPWINQIDAVAGGSLTAGTQYDYCVVYAALDNQGRLWRSRPSIIRSATPSGGNLSVRLRIPYYTATLQDENNGLDVVTIEIYRRAPASDPFVRIHNAGIYAYANNAASTTYLEVTDTGFSITDQPNLYTTGGVLEAFTPPPCTQTLVFDNRLWLFERNTLWYSREILTEEGIAFHPAQTITVGDEADITGIAVMDSSLIIFKAESIFFLQGTGPDDTGANPAYSIPQRVMSAVGCVNLKSIALGKNGVYFQSRRGIEKLGRDLSQEYIGANVEDSFGQAYDVTAAVHVQRDNEIRFTVTAASPTVSSLVYDEDHNVWTRDLFHSAAATQAVSAASVGGSYYWLEKNSVRVYKETVDLYSDESYSSGIVDNWITLKVETGDIIVGNPVGEVQWWRTMLFARRGDSHDLSISLAMNQADSWASPRTWTAAEIGNWMGVPIEIPEVLPSPQRARSIRFLIDDTTSGTPRRGPILYSISLEYGVEGGVARVPAGQRK
jgi:hypothetical protein